MVERAKIPYREVFYECPEKEEIGPRAAEAANLPPQQVFKTLVARGARTGISVFSIPVSGELDLKKAAAAAGDKSISLLPVKELLGVTGYVRGACTPVGMKKKFPVFIDASAQQYDEIAISAGARGHQMLLPPIPFAELAGASFADLTI